MRVRARPGSPASGEHLLDRRPDRLARREAGDVLGLGIERGHDAVLVRREEAREQALHRAVVEPPDAVQLAAAAVEVLARALELPREHAREERHHEERAGVHRPLRELHARRLRAALEAQEPARALARDHETEGQRRARAPVRPKSVAAWTTTST
jgi:hypothetical protein